TSKAGDFATVQDRVDCLGNLIRLRVAFDASAFAKYQTVVMQPHEHSLLSRAVRNSLFEHDKGRCGGCERLEQLIRQLADGKQSVPLQNVRAPRSLVALYQQ